MRSPDQADAETGAGGAVQQRDHPAGSRLDALDLTEELDIVINSAELGLAKPESAAFAGPDGLGALLADIGLVDHAGF